MNNARLRRALLAAVLGTSSSGSLAAGFYLQETSANGLGRAFAAENTVGDNAAILARNPAGSALFETRELTLGVIHVNPEIDARGDVTLMVPGGPSITMPDQATDYATSAWIPNAHLALPVNERWSAGLSMYTNFGLETDFDDDFLVSHIANKTELLSVNLAPSVAFKINDTFSIGAALKVLYAEGTILSSIPEDLALAPSLSGLGVLELEGDAWELGWSVGALWQPNAATRVGLSYHSEQSPELEGELSSDLLPDLAGGGTLDGADGELSVDLPDTLELGIYHRMNANWGLVLGAMWADWADFEALEAYVPGQANAAGGELYNPLLIKEENFESGWRYSLGAEYYRDQLTLRAGYAYDEGAARDGLNRRHTEEAGLDVTWRTLSIPDTDRQWLTFGASYQASETLSVDASLAYLWGDGETIQEYANVPVPTYFDGKTTTTRAWLLGVSLNYRF
ncbi:OmpP1/FadL family transporter [Parahaliea mediterranea]|uniref:Outer membrane protein transport protein n=1 Tax=Parahaliea mediterranea TaxID=651086 RepID=A0A939DDT4_9GAMM|nr:outer membrane protein transport protein [Parahaliea mediterranea]MBN7796415.1 outer membrane protein transport protein [Parahaliea mediterranea]